jgi:TorA maturation chaperone TorD
MTNALISDVRAWSFEATMLAHLWQSPSVAEVSRWRSLARTHPQAVHRLLGTVGADWLAHPDPVSLSAEYEGLIHGPRAWPASPYESLWRDDVPPTQRYGFWPPTIASLSRLYARLPAPLPAESRVDEISVELTALASALENDSTLPLAAELVHEHLALWVPAFLNAVTCTTGHPFYRRLADATSRWLAGIRAEFAANDPTGRTRP